MVGMYVSGMSDPADLMFDASVNTTSSRRVPKEIKHRSVLPDSFHSDLVRTHYSYSYCSDNTYLCTLSTL